MLSDEEREALQYFNTETRTEEMHYGAVLVKLIDKQSKEIEDNKKYIVQLTDEQYRKLVDIIRTEISKEWEDKIKAKIEELIKEGNYRTADNPNGRIHFQKEITDYQIEVLQSLLEKE
jgi:hypothetical protein